MRRSYQDAKTYEQAIAMMKEVSGTQLDKDLLEIFVSIPKQEVDACYPDMVSY